MIRTPPTTNRSAACSIAFITAAATLAVEFCAVRSAVAAEPGAAAIISSTSTTSSLLALGLTPESLAILGVTPTGFDAIRLVAATNPPAVATWAQTCEALAATEADTAALREKIHEQGVGVADAHDSLAKGAALDAAVSDHDEARKAALVAVLAPISGSLSAMDMAMLAAAIQNSQRPVPVECRVLSLDEAQWEALAEGLRRLETGDPIARADHAALVNWAINQPAVSLARARLATLKPGLEAAFAAAMLAEAAAVKQAH